MDKNYSISDLSEISGIQIPTIRIWEQRYKIFTPKRTPTNLRQYSYQDYVKMILVSFLVKRNFRIGQVVQFSPLELHNRVRNELLNQSKEYPEMHAMTIQLLQGDVDTFGEYLFQCLSNISPDAFVIKTLVPLISNLNVIDFVDEANIGNQLIVKNIIQKYLIVVAERKLQSGFYNNNILILRSDNTVSTSLFIIHFLAVIKKYKSDVFFNSLIEDCVDILGEKLNPDVVYTEFNESKSFFQICSLLDIIENTFPEAQIVVSGKYLMKYWEKISNKIYIAQDLGNFYKFL
ncbi:MAG: MerR family transcriptional regulator [Bacteroidales bacterium]|nr:MerR family transcriptional regulator [Bacteroidales bacterium]